MQKQSPGCPHNRPAAAPSTMCGDLLAAVISAAKAGCREWRRQASRFSSGIGPPPDSLGHLCSCRGAAVRAAFPGQHLSRAAAVCYLLSRMTWRRSKCIPNAATLPSEANALHLQRQCMSTWTILALCPPSTSVNLGGCLDSTEVRTAGDLTANHNCGGAGVTDPTCSAHNQSQDTVQPVRPHTLRL